MANITAEARHYDMIIHSITEERDLFKARNTVLEDDMKVMSESLGNALTKVARLSNLIKEIKELIKETEEVK